MKRGETILAVERTLIEMEYALRDALRTRDVSRGDQGQIHAHVPLFVLQSALTSLHQALAVLRSDECLRPAAYIH